MPRELTSAAITLDARDMSEDEITSPAVPATAATSGPDVPPDHLAINPKSPWFNEELLRRGVGIRFKDVVRTNVEEYCISEGWVRLAVGKTVDRRGKSMTMLLKGPVESWFES